MNTKESILKRQRRLALLRAEEQLRADDAERLSNQKAFGKAASARTSRTPPWQVNFAAFPDPWLFDSNKLLNELDRCRELVLMIPNNADRHATHFQREIAVTAIWNLRETIAYLLRLHKAMQHDFAKKAEQISPTEQSPNAPVLAHPKIVQIRA